MWVFPSFWNGREANAIRIQMWPDLSSVVRGPPNHNSIAELSCSSKFKTASPSEKNSWYVKITQETNVKKLQCILFRNKYMTKGGLLSFCNMHSFVFWQTDKRGFKQCLATTPQRHQVSCESIYISKCFNSSYSYSKHNTTQTLQGGAVTTMSAKKISVICIHLFYADHKS